MSDPGLSAPAGPPHGWYPDPAEPGRERLWDGRHWSDQVRLAPGSGPVPVPQTQQPAPPQPRPVPAQTTGRPLGPMTADEVPLAPWGLRLVGMVIDSVIVSVLATVVLQLSVANLSGRLQAEVMGFWSQMVQGSTQVEPTAELVHLQTLLTIATVSVTLVYGLLCLLTLSGTLGQRVLGMRVVPVDHGLQKIPPGAAVLRTVAWALLSSGYGLFQVIQLVNGLMPLWHRRRQTLHDLLSRTQVVRRR